MAEIRQFNEDAMKRIGRAVRWVEHQSRKPPEQKKRQREKLHHIIFQLTGALTAGGSASAVLVYDGTPDSTTPTWEESSESNATLTVYDPLGDKEGESGDRGIAAFVNGRWVVLVMACI